MTKLKKIAMASKQWFAENNHLRKLSEALSVLLFRDLLFISSILESTIVLELLTCETFPPSLSLHV